MTFLLPIIFLPTKIVDSLTVKASLVLIATCLMLFIWAISRLKGEVAQVPFNLMTLSLILIPATYIVSAIFSSSHQVSFFGRDLGFDSALVLAMLFVLTIFVSLMCKDKTSASRVTIAVWISVFVTIIVHLLHIILPQFFPTLGFFVEASSNTIGRWYDLGLIAGVGAVVSLATLELFNFIRPARILLYVLLAINLVMMVVVNFPLLWIIVGITSLIFFVYFLSASKAQAPTAPREIPVASLVTFIISAVFILGGTQINNYLSQFLRISYLEARPSFSANFALIKGELKENPVVGAGPAMFDVAWVTHKPINFNLTEFWNVDFRYGYGLIPTFVVTGGILGLLAWLFFFVMYLYYGAKSLFRPIADNVSRYILVSSFLTSFFLWVISFFYVPSFVIVTLTLIFTGIFIGSLYREGIVNVKTYNTNMNPRAGFVYVFLLVVVMLASLAGLWHITTRIIAGVHYQKALSAVDIDGAQSHVISAVQLYPTDVYLKTLSEIGVLRLNEVLENTNKLPEADQMVAFRNTLGSTVQAIQAAIEFSPKSYTNHLRLGEIFENLIPLKVADVYTAAKDSYNKARELNTKSPAIVLALARLEVANKDNKAARELITKALELKGNYTDAIFLLSQIDVSEGNIKQAIINVEQATIVRPNDPLVFFQLGLLRYQNNDFSGAASAFKNAVVLNNEYDNARYFYGLALDRSKQKPEAIVQFEILNKRYPDNEQVKFILKNLNGGFPALYGSKDPNVTNPEDGEELPIDEKGASVEE